LDFSSMTKSIFGSLGPKSYSVQVLFAFYAPLVFESKLFWLTCWCCRIEMVKANWSRYL